MTTITFPVCLTCSKCGGNDFLPQMEDQNKQYKDPIDEDSDVIAHKMWYKMICRKCTMSFEVYVRFEKLEDDRIN